MKSQKPTFEQIDEYIYNKLPEKGMQEIEYTILTNEAAEAVFHTMIFDYRQQSDYIDSLIGRDEEKNENNSVSMRQNFGKETLNEKPEILNSAKTMKKPDGIILPRNMEEVIAWTETIQETIQNWKEQAKETDFCTFAVKVLTERYAMSSVDAEETVRELRDGIDEFKDCLGQQTQTDTLRMREYLEAHIELLSDEERKNYLTNLLTALQALDIAESEPEAIESKLEALKRGNESKCCDELFEEILLGMESVEMIDRIVDAMGASLDTETVAGLRNILATDPLEQTLFTALALYISQRDEKINLTADGNNCSAKMAGTAAAAAVEMLQTTARLETGEIDRNAWMKWMKTIFGVLLVITLGLAGLMLTGYVGSLIILTLMSFFGQGIIATFLAFAITVPVISLLAGKVVEGVAWVMDFLSKPYDIALDRIVRFVETCWLFVQNKFSDRLQKQPSAAEQHKEQTQQQERTQTATQSQAPDLNLNH